jgi:hypothetical protein
MAAVAAAAGVVLSLASPSASQATSTCWQRVVADWTDGHIDQVYPLQCYRDAVRHLPEDLRTYSSAADDIHRALFRTQSMKTGSTSSTRATHVIVGPAAAKATLTFPLGVVVISSFGGAVLAIGGVSVVLAMRRRRGRVPDKTTV